MYTVYYLLANRVSFINYNQLCIHILDILHIIDILEISAVLII